MEGESGLWSLFQRAPVDWTEPLVIGLLVFHVLCFVITIFSFKFYKFQIVHFLIMVALVSSSEYINEFAALNLYKYSKQQYFDSSGMFISLAFSAPLLCNTIIIVVHWVYKTLCVMTELKTLQKKRKSAREKKKEN